MINSWTDILIQITGSTEGSVALLFATGFVIGIIASLFGLGGGFFFTPFFHSILNIPGPYAIATAITHICIQSSVTSFIFIRKKQIKYKIMGNITIAAVISGQFSAYLLSTVSSLGWWSEPAWKQHTPIDITLYCLYAFVMISLILASQNKLQLFKKNSAGESSFYEQIIVGAIAGFLSSILGIGGGFLVVPYLVSRLNFSPAQAAAGSIFMIVLVSFFSMLQYFAQGLVIWQISLITASGSMLGALVGTSQVYKLKQEQFSQLFAGLQFLVLLVYSIRFFFSP